MASNVRKPALSLKQFMLRQQVIKLYRDILRCVKQVPDKESQNELRQWVRQDFEKNKHHTEEGLEAVNFLLQSYTTANYCHKAIMLLPVKKQCYQQLLSSTAELTIKMMIKHGERSLKELQQSLDLSSAK